MKKSKFLVIISCFVFTSLSAQYAPAAGQEGSTAIHKDSSVFIAWATGAEVRRGFLNISDTNVELSGSNKASFGDVTNSLGGAEGTSSDVISIGDSGEVVLTFSTPILNGVGPDFAVFENSFADDYLEFAFVEVSSNGTDFFRFPSFSNIPYDIQTGPFGYSDPTLVRNLAGKYKQGYGTPFDLSDLDGALGLNLNAITHVKILDVVGSINSRYGGQTNEGDIINDPFPTPFESGGFDLDAVGVIHTTTSGVSEIKNYGVEFYPNPTSGIIHVPSLANIEKLELFDLTGRFITSLPLLNQINIKSFVSSGVYLLASRQSGQLMMQRIIVR